MGMKLCELFTKLCESKLMCIMLPNPHFYFLRSWTTDEDKDDDRLYDVVHNDDRTDDSATLIRFVLISSRCVRCRRS